MAPLLLWVKEKAGLGERRLVAVGNITRNGGAGSDSVFGSHFIGCGILCESEKPMDNLLDRLFWVGNRYLGSRLVQHATSEAQAPSADQLLAPPVAELSAETLQPVKNWSHPFKDKNHALLQLTQLATADAGYYPLGRNGQWHGGVHFDGGTAGVLDQSSVRCLADGEVIAYRIEEHSPTTTFISDTQSEAKPFSRNFVLVRHLLQPPLIEGSSDTPPTLIFYSLYMHLQDWAVYRADSTVGRPAFWPEGDSWQVSDSASDSLAGVPEQLGLNVHNQAGQGTVIGHLPRGTKVTISGDGDFRMLENTLGPAPLINDEGALRGYLAFHLLEPIAGRRFRIKTRDSVNVRAEASIQSDVIAQLPAGTQVTVSGEGEFRKLEHINQYVHFKSLQSGREPKAYDRIVLPDPPITIKAGELIGHIGLYQNCCAEQAEKKLHLEVISGEGVDAFIEASRTWAQRLPASEKTWLKLVKGTSVIAHQDHYGPGRYPAPDAITPVSGTDLLLPKSLLDSLPADFRINVPSNDFGKTVKWYRLEGLLNDAANNVLDGWVCEEVGVTPWVSPWSWEGYDIIFSYDSPLSALASFYRDLRQLSEAQLERFHGNAEEGDKGRVKSRLYDLLDRNRDGKITAEELQAAIRLPAHAQSISQLIVRCESEWYRPQRWDMLDEILGHSGSTPHLNWLAEKQRITALSWWGEVAQRVGLPAHGEVYHFHPVGLVGWFSVFFPKSNFIVRRGQVTFDAEGNETSGSPYFSRHLHWPGGASGVTLGRGYDMRYRTSNTVYSDLTAAGVEPSLSRKFARGAGLYGQAARDFVHMNKYAFGMMSPEAQRVLFEDVIYPRYEEAAQRRYGIFIAPDSVQWEELDERIRDVAVDFTYQQGSIWDRQLHYISANNRDVLARYIRETPELAQYEWGRNRARYLSAEDFK